MTATALKMAPGPGAQRGGGTWQVFSGGGYSSPRPEGILDKQTAGGTSSTIDDWRVPVAKLAEILRAEQGWDLPNSQPADRTAVANYTSWLSDLAVSKHRDAEPMLTDEGHIRLEWRRGDNEFTAEIGPARMWLCILAADPAHDRDVDVAFDAEVLRRFFTAGIWPE